MMVDEHESTRSHPTKSHPLELPGMMELIRRNVEGALHRLVPEVGLVVDDTWELTRLLGKGGFGLVFEAWHVDLESSYAIKFLDVRRDSEDVRSRFLAEARLMAEIRSEHLVRVLNYGELPGGTPYFVMDLVKGHDLRPQLREPLPVARALSIAEQVLAGLAVVHERQVVHGDIKPENIIIEDENDKVRLLDFGLAQIAALVGRVRGGTPPYMAPEMLLEDVSANFQTDVFAVGVVMYEMLTGRLPRGHARMDYDAIRRCWTKKPDNVPLRMYVKDVPKPLDDLVLEALSREPSARPPSAGAMLAKLRRARQQTSAPADLEVWSTPNVVMELEPRPTTTIPRWRWGAPVVVAGALAVSLGTSLGTGWSVDDTPGSSSRSVEAPSPDSSREDLLVTAPLDASESITPALTHEEFDASNAANPGQTRAEAPVGRPLRPPLRQTLRPKTPAVARGLTRARFESLMAGLRDAARNCANTAEIFPGTEVSIVVKVDPAGHADAVVDGAEALLPIGACLEQAIETTAFDRTHQGGTHAYVFEL